MKVFKTLSSITTVLRPFPFILWLPSLPILHPLALIPCRLLSFKSGQGTQASHCETTFFQQPNFLH